jgi:hypothetical protein
MQNFTFHENVEVDVLEIPATITTNTSSYLSMEEYESAIFFMSIGATDDTVDMKVVQATDSSGTSSKDITGAAITQLTGSDDNKYASIEIHESDLDIQNSFTHVATTVTIAGTTTGTVWCNRYPSESAPLTQPTAYTEQVDV